MLQWPKARSVGDFVQLFYTLLRDDGEGLKGQAVAEPAQAASATGCRERQHTGHAELLSEAVDSLGIRVYILRSKERRFGVTFGDRIEIRRG